MSNDILNINSFCIHIYDTNIYNVFVNIYRLNDIYPDTPIVIIGEHSICDKLYDFPLSSNAKKRIEFNTRYDKFGSYQDLKDNMTVHKYYKDYFLSISDICYKYGNTMVVSPDVIILEKFIFENNNSDIYLRETDRCLTDPILFFTNPKTPIIWWETLYNDSYKKFCNDINTNTYGEEVLSKNSIVDLSENSIYSNTIIDKGEVKKDISIFLHYSEFLQHFIKNIKNKHMFLNNNNINITIVGDEYCLFLDDFFSRHDINKCISTKENYIKLNDKNICSLLMPRISLNTNDNICKIYSLVISVLEKKYNFFFSCLKLKNNQKVSFCQQPRDFLKKYNPDKNFFNFVSSIIVNNYDYLNLKFSICNHTSLDNKIIIYDKIDNSCFTNDLFGKRVLLTQLRKEYLSELDEYNIDYSYFTFYAEYPNIVDFLYRAYMNTVNNPDDKDNYDDTNEEDVDMSNNMIATSVTPIEKRCLAVLERTYNVAQIDNILDGNDYMDSGSNDVIISDLSLNYDLGIKDGIIDYSFNEITRGYINKVLHLRRSKFCVVHNNAPEKHRSYLLMECLMSGCIPIIDDTIRPDDFLVPLEKGVHYLRMPEDKDVNSLVGEIDEVTREKMSLACLEYYGENVYSKNIFSTIFNMFCKFKK